ncbi:unnamed protein product [Echinostoma caproni]|uniref:CUB domain-containing protein n=1 Tax=Echinostoma caproni TaxID=27848 RepID=A0A183APR6_9TREM|nr:unnamed protein product [Echinostoma caproni]
MSLIIWLIAIFLHKCLQIKMRAHNEACTPVETMVFIKALAIAILASAAIGQEESPNCNATFVGVTGTKDISQQQKSTEAKAATCTVTVNTQQGYKLKLKVTDLSIGSTTNCMENYVKLGSTSDLTGPDTLTVCGSSVPTEPFNTTGDQFHMKIKVTDFAKQPVLSLLYKSNDSVKTE